MPSVLMPSLLMPGVLIQGILMAGVLMSGALMLNVPLRSVLLLSVPHVQSVHRLRDIIPNVIAQVENKCMVIDYILKDEKAMSV